MEEVTAYGQRIAYRSRMRPGAAGQRSQQPAYGNTDTTPHYTKAHEIMQDIFEDIADEVLAGLTSAQQARLTRIRREHEESGKARRKSYPLSLDKE